MNSQSFTWTARPFTWSARPFTWSARHNRSCQLLRAYGSICRELNTGPWPWRQEISCYAAVFCSSQRTGLYCDKSFWANSNSDKQEWKNCSSLVNWPYRKWRLIFREQSRSLPKDWSPLGNEELNTRASDYVRANAAVKGKPNLTSIEFCKWVNKTLLPNWTLEPGFPRRISVETARKWLHEMGFEVLTARKGIFVNGHERPDVIESREKFLRKMVKVGSLHFTNAPTKQAGRALPEDVEPPVLERREKTVIFFHDETTFQSNGDQTLQWPRGTGIMLSDFIDEKIGFLCLTDEEYERAKQINPSAKKYARQFLEYGENREGYWTCDKFVA